MCSHRGRPLGHKAESSDFIIKVTHLKAQLLNSERTTFVNAAFSKIYDAVAAYVQILECLQMSPCAAFLLKINMWDGLRQYNVNNKRVKSCETLIWTCSAFTFSRLRTHLLQLSLKCQTVPCLIPRVRLVS